ncbi:MAG: hypothetical protein P8010_24755 [Desulfosarcinaceae bacterium]|jgi:hypothetical protein
MQQYFNDLLGTDGVLGLMLLSFQGEVLYKADPSQLLQTGTVDKIAMELTDTLTDAVQEADMVFSRRRVYLRRTPIGPLLIILTLAAPIALVRLHCDTLIPSLKPPKRAGGLKRLFGKWR